MSARISNLISAVKARGHEVWEGGAATADAIHEIEGAIGTALPPSYVAFLQTHGSIAIQDAMVSGVVEGNRVNDGMGTVLGDTETLRAEGGLPDGFLVIGPHGDGGYCLDLRRRRPDGECPVVNFEMGSVQHDKPIAETFEEWMVEFVLKPLSR